MLTVSLNAQEEKKVIIKKEKVVTVKSDNSGDSDKTVTIDVDDSDVERTIKIRTVEDGEEKIIEWKDQGEIPEDIKKQLEADGIDIQILEEGQNAVFIGDDSDVEEVRIIKSDKGDKDVEIEWDGEGEMPEDLKLILDEHDIDLKELKKGKKGAKVRMRMLKEDRRRGPEHRMRWVEEGGKMHKKPEVNVYMGAQIGDGDGGTSVLDVMVDSPAHKAGLKKGDVISEINGANTKNVDDLMRLLSMFDVDDTIEVKYMRSGKTKTTKVKLVSRPEPYR